MFMSILLGHFEDLYFKWFKYVSQHEKQLQQHLRLKLEEESP